MEKNSMIYLHSMPHRDEKSYTWLQAAVRVGLHLWVPKISVQYVNCLRQGKHLMALLLLVY